MRMIVLLSVLVAALSTVGVAGSASVKSTGVVKIGVRGWGEVTPGKGFSHHRPIVCRQASCPSKSAPAGQARRVTLGAKPYKGWKLAGWHGACKGTKPTCTIDLSHEPVSGGVHRASVRVVFAAVAPGLTRGNPIPLGQTADIGGGFQWRINSFTPSVQLSPPAQPGHQYAVANVTATYAGGSGTEGGLGRLVQQDFKVIGSHNVVYSWGPGGPGSCPGAPEPDLSQNPAILSPGQSATGNVCWEIASDDAATLEAEIPYWNPSGATTWFALR